MLSPVAVQQFLARKLDDHSWLKRVPESELDSLLVELTGKYGFRDLLFHQKVGLLLGASFPSFYYVFDLGSGKSLLSLRLLEHYYSQKFINKWSVILVPTDTAVLGWVDQINEWRPDIPYVALLGDSKDKWQALIGFTSGLVVVTYPGYSAMVSEIRQVIDRSKHQKKNKRVPSLDLLRKFSENVDALVLDEVTFCGSVQTLIYETVRPLSFKAKVRYALAGRPFGRDPTVMWPQMFLVDHGLSLSSQLSVFREAFFIKKKKYWGGPNSYEYVLKKDREPDLRRAIAHRSLSYAIDECVSLPERVATICRVSFPEDTELYYQRVVKALVEHRGNFREVENAFIKMRQIASGFLGFVDDDSGERAQVEFKHNPKLDELMQLLRQMPDGAKALVFHEYTWSGARICRELAAAKIKHGWLWGGSKDWPQTKERFEKDPAFQVLVINSHKGAFALNLQRANYVFFYESPVSPIVREQAERRAFRQGQTQRVLQYDLVVKGSVEERILHFHKEGGDLMRALVADPAKALA